MSRFAPLVASLLIVATPLFADEDPRRVQTMRATPRHYVVEMEHTLRPAETAALADRGIDVQQVMPGNRYIVRATSAAMFSGDPNVRSVGPLPPQRKLNRLALRAAASSAPFVSVMVRFHDDVGADDAIQAVEAAGGSVETPLQVVYNAPQHLQVRIPPAAIARLAADDNVMVISGKLKAAPVNSVAAQMSHVAPLFSAPYNLDGSGVTLSLFEASGSSGGSAVDASHPEFSGRVSLQDTSSISTHATHVTGTMIAQGLDAHAKGMAPAASAVEYALNNDFAVVLTNKQNLSSVNSVADNNSWGFQLGWQEDNAGSVWYGGFDFFGAYDSTYSAPYDKIARDPNTNVLFVHSSGNDGDQGHPFLDTNGRHRHVADADGSVLNNEIFCYSKNGSGTDCPTPTCSLGISTKSTEDDGSPAHHCEAVKHPTYGPFNTLSFIAAEKNVLAVGAISSDFSIAGFSSRGPAKDGRVKPDLVAKGVDQYSTLPGGRYGIESGTSMSSPVVTGIAALIAQQWRKTFGGNPTPQQIKTLMIAGADDIGNPGPDYTFGFGLIDAQASVDDIIADNKTGARIRNGSVTQGDTVQIPMTVAASGNVRVVLGWADPEVVLNPDEFADKTLVNDLDLKIIDPSGATVLPYVLDPNNPDNNATRGVNSVDNTEEVEIANAQPGVYNVVIMATKIAAGPTQGYVLVANKTLGQAVVPCGDPYEPNDTEATAFRYLISATRITAKTCSATDLDFYAVKPTATGPLSVTATASDTPLKVTLSGNGITPITGNASPGASVTLGTQVTNPGGEYLIKVEPAGTVGSNATYTLLPTFNSTPIPRTHRVGHP